MSFNPLETAAVIFGIVSVYLSVRENIWSWPTAIINVTLYIFVFFRARLYADMALQVVYIVISIYGWYEWLHGGKGKSELAISRGTKRLAVTLAGIGIGATALIAAALSRYTNAALPLLDSTTRRLGRISSTGHIPCPPERETPHRGTPSGGATCTGTSRCRLRRAPLPHRNANRTLAAPFSTASGRASAHRIFQT